MNKESRNKDR